jgi:hypothetical protein
MCLEEFIPFLCFLSNTHNTNAVSALKLNDEIFTDLQIKLFTFPMKFLSRTQNNNFSKSRFFVTGGRLRLFGIVPIPPKN